MTAMLTKFCFLAVISGALCRPQYIATFRAPAPAPPSHDVLDLPPVAYDAQDDIDQVAARKRNYQAAFAALASQMAAQTRILTDTYASSNLASEESNQANQNLFHRNVIPISQPTSLVHTNRRVAISSPENTAPIVYPQQLPRLPVSYIYNSVEAERMGEPEQRRQEPAVLANGFLADTPEVEAARREHLAAVNRARAATAGVGSRRASHTPYRPAQTFNRFPVVLSGPTQLIHYYE